MVKIFISYSRTDRPFAVDLVQHMKSAGDDVWIDLEDIRPSADWRRSVMTAIEEADVFVFVITPESVKSEICAEEIAHAVEHRKKLIPLRYKDAPVLPAALSALQWIDFGDATFDAACARLQEAIRTDLDWLQAHTWLLGRALAWERGGKDAGALLHGRDLQEAEPWLERAPASPPQLTELQRRYVYESRVLQDVTLREKARARSRALAGDAVAELRSDPQRGLLLALESAAAAPTPQAEEALREALLRDWPVARVGPVNETDGAISCMRFTPDGRRLLVGYASGIARLWDAAAWQPSRAFEDHSNEISSAAFDASGNRAVTTSRDGSAHVWDVNTGDTVTVFSGQGHEINAGSISADGKLVVTTGADATSRIWEVASGRLIREIRHQGSGSVAEFCQDVNILTSESGEAQLWSVTTGELLRVFPGSPPAVLSPDGKYLVNIDGLAGRIVEIANGRTVGTLTGHTDDIEGVAFSADGSLLATASQDGTARVWDGHSGQAVTVLPHGPRTQVDKVAFGADGRLLATLWRGLASIWELSVPPLVKQFAGHVGQVRSVVFSRDQRWLLTAGSDRTVRVWDIDAGEARHICEGAAGGFTSDGTAVVISEPDRIVVRHLTDLEPVWQVPRDAGSLALVRRDEGTRIVAVTPAGGVLIIDSGADQPLARANAGTDVFSHDGRYVAIVTGGRASLWDVVRNSRIADLPGDDIKSVDISPDGRWLLITTDGGQGFIWDIAAGRRGGQFRVPDEGLVGAFGRDGRTIATAAEDMLVRVWDTATAQQLRTMPGHTAVVWFIALSPNGRWILSGGQDRTARIWDSATGRPLTAIRRHDAAVCTAAFAPDNMHVVTAGANGLVQLFRCDVCGDLSNSVARARARVLRTLTSEERATFLGDRDLNT